MANSNALLIKVKLGVLDIVRGHLAHDPNTYDLDHQIYVPSRFILGNFKDRKEGFKLSEGGIVYHDSSKALVQYQQLLDEGKLEVVKSLLISEAVLEQITQQGKMYLNARENISELVQVADQYFV